MNRKPAPSDPVAVLRWQRAVCKDSTITITDRLVACYMALHADVSTGQFFLSAETMARELGAGERSVRRSIAALLSRGWLRLVQRGCTGRASRYQLAHVLPATSGRYRGALPATSGRLLPAKNDTTNLPPVAYQLTPLSHDDSETPEKGYGLDGQCTLAEVAENLVDTIMEIFPKRPDIGPGDRPGLLKAVVAALDGGAEPNDILDGLWRFHHYAVARWGKAPTHYAPHPLTWLRGRKWTSPWDKPSKAERRGPLTNAAEREQERRALLAEMRSQPDAEPDRLVGTDESDIPSAIRTTFPPHEGVIDMTAQTPRNLLEAAAREYGLPIDSPNFAHRAASFERMCEGIEKHWNGEQLDKLLDPRNLAVEAFRNAEVPVPPDLLAAQRQLWHASA